MSGSGATIQHILDLATQGDAKAREILLERYRDELRRLVETRLDRRIAARVDASDVVQDTLIEAARRLDEYLLERPLPYFAWLRQLAGERIIGTHRQHLHAQRRSIYREKHGLEVPEESAVALVSRLFADDTSPSDRLARKELTAQVMEALALLSVKDREVLLMRHLEQLSTAEIADALEITEAAVKSRLVRALRHLGGLLESDS